MSEVTMPRRTAGECELPGGEKVWVCTLNSVQKEDAQRKARRHAATECRSLMEGGADFESFTAEIARQLPTAERQAQFLANQEYRALREAVESEFPFPTEPEPGEGETPEAHAKAVARWEKEKGKVEKQRTEEIEKRYEQAKAEYLGLTPKARQEACRTAAYNAEFWQAYSARLTLEILLRAVRECDDHLERRFGSMEAVEDLDDAERLALVTRYNELDSLSWGSEKDIPS